MAAAFQSAIKVAKVSGGTIRYGATQPYLLDAPLDLTFPVGGTNLSFAIVGEGQVLANTNTPPGKTLPDRQAYRPCLRYHGKPGYSLREHVHNH